MSASGNDNSSGKQKLSRISKIGALSRISRISELKPLNLFGGSGQKEIEEEPETYLLDSENSSPTGEEDPKNGLDHLLGFDRQSSL